MPTTSWPRLRAERTTERMQEFMPGASPPLQNRPIRTPELLDPEGLPSTMTLVESGNAPCPGTPPRPCHPAPSAKPLSLCGKVDGIHVSNLDLRGKAGGSVHLASTLSLTCLLTSCWHGGRPIRPHLSSRNPQEEPEHGCGRGCGHGTAVPRTPVSPPTTVEGICRLLHWGARRGGIVRRGQVGSQGIFLE